MRLWAFALVLACASCHGWRGGRSSASSCHERVKPGAAAPVAIPAADPELERLLGYRSYYAIEQVGVFEHHFAVWFTCVEQSVSYYAIAEDGTVRDAGGAWGGLAVRSDDVEAVPAAQRARADVIAARHVADYDGASTGRIEYLGSYREVTVTERVPAGSPGDPYTRMMRHVEVRLRANADLTELDGSAGLEGGETFLCWKDIAYGDCTKQHWFEFTPARGVGEPQLAALITAGSPQPADERARFAEAALAAARGKAADDPPASLDAILAAQGTSRLPPGLAPPVVVGFTIYGRVKQGDQPSGAITVELSPVELLAGVAKGRGSATVGGVTFTADVELAVVGGVSSEQDGVVEADVVLRYELSDDRGNRRRAEIPMHLKALVQADAALVTELAVPEGVTQAPHEPPNSQEVPGTGDVVSFDTYLGVSARRDTWYPGT